MQQQNNNSGVSVLQNKYILKQHSKCFMTGMVYSPAIWVVGLCLYMMNFLGVYLKNSRGTFHPLS